MGNQKEVVQAGPNPFFDERTEGENRLLDAGFSDLEKTLASYKSLLYEEEVRRLSGLAGYPRQDDRKRTAPTCFNK